jgi:hypothetical protein
MWDLDDGIAAVLGGLSYVGHVVPVEGLGEHSAMLDLVQD